MRVAITGHRPERVGGYNTPNKIYDAVREALDKQLVSLRPESLITGMALGVDQWAAELCLFNDIPYVAALPFIGYESLWPPLSQDRFRNLCKLARETIMVTPTKEYRPSLLHYRNEWMVRNSDLLLAVWNGEPGGTANCVKAAYKYSKPVKIVDIDQAIWSEADLIYSDIMAKKMAKQSGDIQKTNPLSQLKIEVVKALFTANPPESNDVLKKQVLNDITKTPFMAPKRKLDLD